MVKSEADNEHYLVTITKMYTISTHRAPGHRECSIVAKSHLSALKNDIPYIYMHGVDKVLCKSSAIMICHTFLLQLVYVYTTKKS